MDNAEPSLKEKSPLAYKVLSTWIRNYDEGCKLDPGRSMNFLMRGYETTHFNEMDRELDMWEKLAANPRGSEVLAAYIRYLTAVWVHTFADEELKASARDMVYPAPDGADTYELGVPEEFQGQPPLMLDAAPKYVAACEELRQARTMLKEFTIKRTAFVPRFKDLHPKELDNLQIGIL